MRWGGRGPCAAWLFAVISCAVLGATTGSAQDGPKPKLIVLVIFDQLRGDYLLRWHDLFGPDGFRRLEREGLWFTNCHYPYSYTQTGPGHASLATGCSPYHHGIVGNEWYDRAAGETVNCVIVPRYETVYSSSPPPEKKSNSTDEPEERKPKRSKGAGAPERLLAPTFSDALKSASGGRARVVSIGLKDRSAILPGGQHPDACYWFETRGGTFCTSTYYRDRPVAWVANFNRLRPADRWFGNDWNRLRSDFDYSAWSGPDDVASESTGVGKKQGRVFPHPMNGGLTLPGRAYFDTLYNSPFGNELLLDFALRAIDAEALGTSGQVDFLSISFACNDPIGHSYGPDSQEAMDVTLRSDQIVRDLLAGLDKRLGAGRYVVGLSADHGVCPLPEVSARNGISAGRLDPKDIVNGANRHLSAAFAVTDEKATWFDKSPLPWFYLNLKMIAARGLSESTVAAELVKWLREQKWAQTAYSREQLTAPISDQDPVGRMVQRSFMPERSGDVVVIIKPFHLVNSQNSGTGHGTPHEYDTHVPLIIAGRGIPPGRCRDTVAPQAMAAIFARIAGIPSPAKCEAAVPDSLRSR